MGTIFAIFANGTKVRPAGTEDHGRPLSQGARSGEEVHAPGQRVVAVPSSRTGVRGPHGTAGEGFGEQEVTPPPEREVEPAPRSQ
jgi:hypothetical protein